MKKKNQHYVFRAYLRPWSNKDKIYCLREGRIFFSNLMGVACERFFYKLQDLTPVEIDLIERLLIKDSPEYQKKVQREFLRVYSLIPQMKGRLEGRIDAALASKMDELMVNAGEDLHEHIEKQLLIFLRLMLDGRTDFYQDDVQTALFLHALCVQYTRTKQVREAMLSQVGSTVEGCDVHRLWSALSPLVAMNIGQSLYIERRDFKLVLIDNSTDTPFITADQPIINLHASFDRNRIDKLEFFYPLSPRKAMLLIEASNSRGDSPLSAISVNNYNILMAQNSYEQVFSNSEEYLNSIKNLVRPQSGGQRLMT